MKQKAMTAMLLSSLAVGLGAYETNSRTVFFENFDSYGYHVPNFNAGVSISEAPASLKKLNFYPKDGKRTTLFKTPLVVRNCPADFKMSFKVQFNRAKVNQFELNLTFATKDPKVQKTVLVNLDYANGASLRSPAKVPVAPIAVNKNVATFSPAAGDWQWQNVELISCGGRMDLYMERDGKMQYSGSCFVEKDWRLTGINFTSQNNIGLDDIHVEKIAEKCSLVPAEGTVIKGSAVKITPKVYPTRIVVQIRENMQEKPVILNFQSIQQTYEKPVFKEVAELKDGKLVKQIKPVKTVVRIPDSGMAVSSPVLGKFALNIFTLPKLQWRFEEFEKYRIGANLEKYGRPASEAGFIIEVKGHELWINGNFVRILPMKGKVTSMKVFAGGPAVAEEVSADQALVVRNEKAGVQTVPAFVDFATGERKGFPVARCEENLGSFYLECDGYLSRSAFEAMNNAYHRRVPNAQYNKAVITYSLDGATDRTTDLTLRLTRFWDNGGRAPTAMAEPTVTLPRTEPGKLQTVTLDIPIGRIQDVVFMENSGYIDVEVLGGMYEKDNYYISRANKPALKKSDVRVHKIELIKSPVSLYVKNGNIGNMFYPDETPSVTAELVAIKPVDARLVWTVKDLDGNVVERTEDQLSFSAAGEKKEVKHVFKARAIGHYTYTAELITEEGSFLSKKDVTQVVFDGAYCCMPADTRKAGYESPYFVWNFSGAHGTPKDAAIWSVILKRQGIRRAHTGKYSEKDMKEQFDTVLTLGQFPYVCARGATKEERLANLEKTMRDLVKKYPSCNVAIIFHESGGGPMPMELLGGKTELTEDQIARDKARAETALELAQMWRKVKPGIRLVIGNSGEAIGLLAQLFRQKYPRELIDAMGEESVGMTMPPERAVAYSYWQLWKLAQIYGYKDLMPDACYEWKSRVNRHFTPRQHGALRVRDSLIAHVWENQLIPVMGISEMANSYYNTIWGDDVLTRYPLLQPHPALMANATMTLMLDCAKYTRMIPTGTPTVYVVEFKRGSEYIYTCWTARGNVKAAMDFGKGATINVTDCFGRPGKFASKFEITEEPVYLITDKQIRSVAAELTRTYPNEPAVGFTVAAAMDSAADWKLVTGEDKRIHVPMNPTYLGVFRPGKFEVSTVKDETMGSCIQVKLIPEGDCPELMREYGFLRLDKAIEIPGKPDTIGIQVKGNSSWGKIYLELEDADGEIWLSGGTGGYGCVVYDWSEQMGINFDGWHFLRFPMTKNSYVKNWGPGENEWQWQSHKTGDGKITYPVKVKGVGFALGRKTLNLRNMEDVKDLSIRFKDFSADGADKE